MQVLFFVISLFYLFARAPRLPITEKPLFNNNPRKRDNNKLTRNCNNSPAGTLKFRAALAVPQV